MKNIKFEDGKVYLSQVTKRPKKITGTRFGAVLNVNKWQTPFLAWCEITRTWEEPFEGSIYTEAGKVIEDKQLTWFSRYLPVVRPTDVYGKDFFEKTRGDFFKDSDIFGGMWDGLVGTKDEPTGVIECKTTKRSEDWADDIPEYYALQAALYAYLKGLDDVYMIVTFLDEGDYEKPEAFVCTADNTAYVHFKVSERYPEFQKYIDYCIDFWNRNVLTGISPEYDEKRDKECLAALRTNVISDNSEIDGLIAEAEELYLHIEEVKASIKKDESRLKDIEAMLKKYVIENEEDGQEKAVFKGSRVSWSVSRSEKMSLDTDRLKEAGIYDNYLKNEVSYTIRKSINKDKDGDKK